MGLLTYQIAADRIRSYILENYLYMRQDASIADDDPLLEKGIIDSMAVMELVALLEDELGVSVADDEVNETTFGSIAAMARFAVAKATEAGSDREVA
jgi:acyl carrier protein